VTIHIADIASYQEGLTLADLQHAGFTGVNVKISHELGIKSVHPDAHRYVRDARAMGIGVSTFHWLTGRAPGRDQAAFAYSQMQQLPGGTAGLAHVVDVESTVHPPTAAQWLEYCVTMQHLLGRPIATYTGDWWWLDHMAGVVGPTASPWLWSAPRAGYLRDYPGDAASDAWRGYAGWPYLAVMQYRVDVVAGINVSQSAIRDPLVWDAMRGVSAMAWENTEASESLLAEFNYLAPGRDKASDGTIGDAAHKASSSDHNVDDGPGQGATPSEDADSIPETHALDVDSSGQWPVGWSMERCVQIMLSLARAGRLPGLQNIIYRRRIWSRSWGWTERTYTGSNPHDKHAHFGVRYGSGSGADNPENFTGPWGIRATREKELEELEMPSAEEIASAIATKLGADLRNANSSYYKGTADAAKDGARLLLWDAIHAVREDSVYQAAPDTGPDSKQEMRNTRDLYRELFADSLAEATDDEGTTS
jgi:hypothetical protein